MAVVVASRKVGSAFHKERKRLRPCVPLGCEVSCRSAALTASIDVCAVCDEPGNRSVDTHMSKSLQRRAVTGDAAVHRQPPGQEYLCNVIGPFPVSLKVA
jgi:hypothetical protein